MADERQLALRDEVAVETTLDGAYVTLDAVVTNILTDVFWLALPLPDARLLALVPGQRLHLCFDRPGGPMVLESTFIRRLGGDRLGTEKSRVFAVERPPGLETAERRAHVRVELERVVRIRVPSADAPRGYLTADGRTVNISAGGLQFATELPLCVGDDVVLALVLSSRLIITAGAQVVRIEEPAGDGEAAAGAGACAGDDALTAAPPRLHRAAVRFTRIAESDRERIACYILAARRLVPPRRHAAHATAAADAASAPIHAASDDSGAATGEPAS